VESKVSPLPYFATQVDLGKNGIEKIHPLPQLDEFEKKRYNELLPELEASIKKGVEYVKKNPPK